ncbi:MAG: glycosyltransferase family 39 protein [Candidatus Levyibacteriota bacterium]
MYHRIEEYLEKNWMAAPIILALIAFMTFFTSLPNGLVLDDASQVTNNVQVTTFNIPQIFLGSSFGLQGTTKTAGVYYKPLMTTAYAVVYKLSGANPSSFHLLQILLHMANTILVFYIFKKFFKPSVSLLGAVLFAIHPLNAESVLYISALQEPLFFVFGAIGFLIICRENLGKKELLASAILFTLSLLSKETGVLFIVAALLYQIVVLGKKSRLYRLGMSLIPVFGLYAFMRIMTVGLIPTSHDKPYPIMRLSLLWRILNVPAEFYYYLRNFFVPYDFAVAEHWVVKSLTPQDFYLPLAIDLLFVGAVSYIAFRLYKKKMAEAHAFLFFALLFFIGMAAHMNVFPLDVTVADRWFYFPAVGMIGMLGVFFTSFRFEHKTEFVIVSIILLSLLCARTVVRTLDWRDGLTLDLRDIKYSKDSFPLENNLGYEYIIREQYDLAEPHVRKSTELGPWWWLNWNNLGSIYRHKGYAEDPKYYQQAEEYFLKAVNNTTFYLPYENLADLLVNYGSPQRAQEFIIKTSHKIDLSGMLWFDLALAQLQLKDTNGALQAAYQSSLLMPNDPRAGQLYEAIKTGKQIILNKPKY